jgi:uncharacterized caspase-like protein
LKRLASLPVRAPVGALVAVLAATTARPARADDTHAHAYAVVVGDDLGGAGQQVLRFAEDDARSVAQVLREIGHYDAGDVRVLLRPDAAQLFSALDAVTAKVRADAGRGESSQVLFYFSGHARATALELGPEEVSLPALRDRLRAIPATLTIAVLDACQSGAFARPKGAEPASDFSYNSVSHLTQRGLAVMASSTAEELSQESDELRASYFTHHLVTGLRGAGDADGDGRVSLDEAYRYAYRRTLASTARTQIGEQHATLETDLAGQGDVPVTYPAEAKARLVLPSALDGRVLVQHRASGAVVAEVQKAAGARVGLALVAGEYDAVVSPSAPPGTSRPVLDCRLTLSDDREAELDTSACTAAAVTLAIGKGYEGDGAPDPVPDAIEPYSRDEQRAREDRWAIEVAVGATQAKTDGYTSRLNEFGYKEGFIVWPRVSLGLSRILIPHLAVLVQASTLSADTYERSIGSEEDDVTLRAFDGVVYLRTYLDGPVFGAYAQAGVGPSLGVVTTETQQTGVPPKSSDTSVGYAMSGALGVTARLRHLVTFFGQGGFDYAPAITNLIGDTHDSGGFSLELGMRFRLGM